MLRRSSCGAELLNVTGTLNGASTRSASSRRGLPVQRAVASTPAHLHASLRGGLGSDKTRSRSLRSRRRLRSRLRDTAVPLGGNCGREPKLFRGYLQPRRRAVAVRLRRGFDVRRIEPSLGGDDVPAK